MIAGHVPEPEIVSRLDGVRATATGWQARCPAHDDRTASLSVNVGDDGRTLIFCHAGCETADVVKAAGVEMKSLAQTNALADTNGKSAFEIDRVYDYRDEAGALSYQVCRLRPKGFRQRAPNPGGGWTWKTAGIRKVLYRLPELLAADPAATVFVVEGEKDADRLASIGLVATSSPGGAGKWRAEYAESLRGHSAVVLPDNDESGRDHSEQVANSLSGIATSIKIVSLPDLPGKGDVSDWLAAGHTVDELIAIVAAAAEWAPTAKKRQPRSARPTVSDDATDLRAASGRTDAGNARRLAQLHGDDLRWCDAWKKWLVWDGRRWALDAECRVDAMAKEVGDAVWRQAGILLPDLDHGTAKELTSFARMTASSRGIVAMIALAHSEPGIPVMPDNLDGDPWVLNCMNGTLELETGTLRAFERGDLLTKICPTIFDPDAKWTEWEKTIGRIFGGNAKLSGFVQRLLGAAIVGTVTEHILPIFWGGGANGKGLLLEVVMDVLGADFACKISADVLLATKNDRHPTELADLHGKRLVVASETDDGRRLREGLLKEITGGDTIKARRMREDFWQFRPSHTLILLTNHRPTVRGQDHGIWRRLRLVPFVQTFWDADRGETGPADLQADKHLRDKLRAEHPGILRWLVDGCRQWQADGLQEPSEVKAATAAYRSSQDVLGAFIGDRCLEGERFTAKGSMVYAAYVSWCQANGEHVVSQRRFGDAMSERGIERYTNNGTWYRRLMLATEPRNDTEPISG